MSWTLEQRQKAMETRRRRAQERSEARAEVAESVPPPPIDLPRINLGRYGLPPDIVEKIRADARAKVEAELRARDKGEDARKSKELFDAELLRYRRDAGLANHLDDLVEITINTPPFTDKLMIDGIQYFQGYTYTVSRRQYNDMMETMARGWDAEDRAGNPNRKYYRTPGQTQNPFALQRFLSDGSALHRATGISAKSGATWNTPIDNVIDEAVAGVAGG